MELFRAVEVLRVVFNWNYVPKREEFYELTPEQYKRYYATEGKNDSRDEKVFMLLPHDAQKYDELASGDVYVVTDSEMHYFDIVEGMIDYYCKNSDKPLKTLEDRLYYAAKFVPEVCVKGTKYEKTRLIYLEELKNKKSKKNKKK
jgi:hypothetical protein